MPRNVLVVPVDEGFAVKVEENDDAVSVHDTKEQALQAARAAAETEGGDVLVLDPTGELIQQEPGEEAGDDPVVEEPAAGP